MTQVLGSFTKTFKSFMRIRAVPIFTVIMPIFLLLITGVSFKTSVSASDLPLATGVLTISMIAFSLMLAGTLNLAGSVSRDRETGLLRKLRSMPISPWRDFLGRIMAVSLLTLTAAVVIFAVGLANGARYSGSATQDLGAIGYLLLAILSAAGIGLVVGSLTKVLMATFFTGLGISLVTAFISGIFIPYENLPTFLQAFGRFYPISSATSSSIYLLLGERAIAYNPLTSAQVIATIVIAIGFIGVGVIVYTKRGWNTE